MQSIDCRHRGDVVRMGVSVRVFSPEFTDGVVAVILPIQQAEFDIPIKLEDQPDLLNIENFYQTGLGNFWVALADNEVVGTIGLLDIGQRQGALRKMFVKATHRGAHHGVAAALLQELLAWAKHKNYAEIFLGTTDKFHAAQRFYEKNDFCEIEKNKLPKSFPIMQVDSKFYRIAIGNEAQ